MRTLYLNKALAVNYADRVFAVAVAHINIELIGFLGQTHVADLRAEVVRRQLHGFFLAALAQKVGCFNLGRAGRNCRDFAGLRVNLDVNLDGVGRSAGVDRGVHRLFLNLGDIFLRGVRNNTLNHVTHHCQRNTDGGNNLGVFGDGVGNFHLVGAVANQGSCTAAAADKLNLIVLELILLSQLADALVNLLKGFFHDAGCQLFNGDFQAVGNGLHRLAGCICVAVCKVLRLNKAQHVCSAGVRDGDALAVFQTQSDIVGRVAGLRAHELNLRIFNFLFRGKDCVFTACNVRRARAYVHNVAVADANHGAAGCTQNANVQRVDIGGVTADDSVVNAGTAVFNYADVGGGAAYLKVYRVGSAQVHQRAHNGSGGAGHCGQNGAFAHFADFHNAAVAAHDHQGNRNACRAHGGLRCVCRCHHLGQNGRVDGCGAGAAG